MNLVLVPMVIEGQSLRVYQYPVGQAIVSILKPDASILFSLLQEFKKCPAAEALLSQVASSTNLIFQYINDPKQVPKTQYSNQGPVIILSPFPNEDPLLTLGFELFNAGKGDIDYTKAEKGEQTIDEFAKVKGMDEYDALKVRYNLYQQCSKDWNLKKMSAYSKLISKAVYEFTAEFQCHFDHYRKKWRKNFKEVFCAKHPKDVECKTPKKLCDPSKFHYSKQDSAIRKWKEDRFCELFLKAPAKLKDELEDDFEDYISSCLESSAHREL